MRRLNWDDALGRFASMRIPASLSLVLALTSLPLAEAEAPADAAVRVDEVFADWDSPHRPGCAVAVEQGGLRVLSRAYGMAELEHDLPNTPETIFEAGSVSKQFTAAAVVLLSIDGELSLDDDVRKHIPEVPDYGETITLRHLMTHTSGLRDWGSVASISGWGRQQRTHTHDHVLDIVRRQSALNFDPGHEYSYSNTGYNLLAILVERVSGTSFAEFSRARLFEPLGMSRTQWRNDYTRIVKGRSSAYAVRDDAVSIQRPIEDVHGNGGLLTTVGDLLTWNRALAEGRFGPEFTRRMHERGRLDDGTEIAYAAGLRIAEFAGVPSITHTGSTSGYRAFLGRYPEHDLSVAMLCNASNVSTSGTGGKVARIYLGDAASPPDTPTPYEASAAELSSLTGLYRNVRTGASLSIELVQGSLRMDETPLVPISPLELSAGPGGPRLSFEPVVGGRPRLRVPGGEVTAHYEPVDEFHPTESDRNLFSGTFHSEDAETTLVVADEDGQLTVTRRPGWSTKLEPTYADTFEARGLGRIRFHRSGGRVLELSLRQSRVYDMRFRRVIDR